MLWRGDGCWASANTQGGNNVSAFANLTIGITSAYVNLNTSTQAISGLNAEGVAWAKIGD